MAKQRNRRAQTVPETVYPVTVATMGTLTCKVVVANRSKLLVTFNRPPEAGEWAVMFPEGRLIEPVPSMNRLTQWQLLLHEPVPTPS